MPDRFRKSPQPGSLDQATQWILRMLDREEAEARERQRLQASGWQPAPSASTPHSAGDPRFGDGRDALVDLMQADLDQREALTTEARRRVDQQYTARSGRTQLAQNAPGGQGGTAVDLGTQPTAEDLAFANTSAMEGMRGNVYDDGRGIPTVGYGYALAVQGPNGWAARPDNDLAQVGITLGQADKARLQTVINDLNSLNRTTASQNLQGRLGRDPFDLTLDNAQARQVFDLALPEYRRAVVGAIGQRRYNDLLPEQRAALLDFAYRRPSWLTDNASGLQQAINNDQAHGSWSNTRAALEQIGNATSDWRTQSDALYFANPLAEDIYQIREGDTLSGISRRTGLPESYLRALNPQVASMPANASSSSTRRNGDTVRFANGVA
jgi:GH24 family phage-related lysozyme (muramidase)